jgi:hypothetical protein
MQLHDERSHANSRTPDPLQGRIRVWDASRDKSASVNAPRIGSAVRRKATVAALVVILPVIVNVLVDVVIVDGWQSLPKRTQQLLSTGVVALVIVDGW